jgi:hypothetical protein
MNSARIVATWESQPGMPPPRRRKRASAAPLPAGTATSVTATTVTATAYGAALQTQPNVQARVIAVLIAGLTLLVISLAGVRMLDPEGPPAEPSAVLSPAEVFTLEQSSELKRERARAKHLAEKIDFLAAANEMSKARLKDSDKHIREQDDLLRHKADLLHKAQEEASEAARKLRQAKNDLEEKERLLREKEDLLRENDARLKAYESAKHENERRIRELEKQLAKTAARPVSAGLPEGEWPSLLRNNFAFKPQVRALKGALETLDKETDSDAWSSAMQNASEIIDGLSGRLKNYPITDAAANDARSFLSDTLPARLYALKKKKR